MMIMKIKIILIRGDEGDGEDEDEKKFIWREENENFRIQFLMKKCGNKYDGKMNFVFLYVTNVFN